MNLRQTKQRDFFSLKGLRNRGGIECLRNGKSVYKVNFNYGGFAIIRSQACYKYDNSKLIGNG